MPASRETARDEKVPSWPDTEGRKRSELGKDNKVRLVVVGVRYGTVTTACPFESHERG